MATGVGREAFQQALPDVTSTMTLDGLEQPVEVYRDRLGIPHIRAATMHDAFFGQGFIHAQDRLWQMEFDRRRGAGRWAEVAGPGVALDSDILMRRLQINESCQADYEAFDDGTKAMFDAYAAGVNAFIETTQSLPVEFALLGVTPERWESWHSCAIFKVRHVLMGSWGLKLWRARILKHHGPDTTLQLGVRGNQDGVVIVPPGEEYRSALGDMAELEPGIQALAEMPDAGGSNNWAVHGDKTHSGKPLAAGDPHRFIDVPNVYYQCHLACPVFDVIGFNFAGIPAFPHFAHNAEAAWCITHAMADYQDLYVERFRNTGDGGYEYEFQGEWKPAPSSRETVNVRGKDPVEIEIVTTRHGPVVIGSPDSGHAIAMHYTALDRPNLGLTCLLPQLMATSVRELMEAMRNWVDPCNSMTMADVHGNIGYLHRGRMPIRPAANGWLPVPGWTGEYEWQGNIPFEELPRSYNPDTGYVATANNRVVGDDYPHYLSHDYAPPFRGMRLVERLSAMQDATIDDMGSLHADRVSIPSRDFVAALSTISVDDETAQAALQRLQGWDNVMNKHAVAPAIYAVIREHLTRLAVERPLLKALRDNPYIGEPAPLTVEARLWSGIVAAVRDNDTTVLAEGESWDDLLRHAVVNGVAWLRENLGDDMEAWTWGKLHVTNPIHPLAGAFPELAADLNPPSVSIGGDGDTVQAAATFPGQSYRVNGTSVARYAFDTADWDNSRWVVPLGASGHPASPHFADQADDWSDVKMNPMTYSWDKVVAAAATTQRLEPKG